MEIEGLDAVEIRTQVNGRPIMSVLLSWDVPLAGEIRSAILMAGIDS